MSHAKVGPMKVNDSSLPPVSIAINNFNYGRFVREAIESALNQDYPNCEVIIIDDGSTDNSREIIEEYRDRAKVVFKSNGGQASAFNAGLSHSTGEIVLFLDSDDYLFPNAISKVVAHWKPGISRCHFRLSMIDQEGKRIGREPSDDRPLSQGNLAEGELSRQGIVSVPTSGNAFRRAVLEKVFPVDERFRICADGWIRFRTAAHGDVLAIEEALGAYRIHGSNSFAGSYVGPSLSDSQIRKVLQGKLAQVHVKLEACLALDRSGRSLWSFARERLYLYDIRALLLARHLGVPGPVTELDRQFTYSMLQALLFAGCLRGESPLLVRLQYLCESLILFALPPVWKRNWLCFGLNAKRKIQKLFRRSLPARS